MVPQQLFFLRAAGALGATGVILGAFAAHGLKQKLPADLLAVFEVGVRYHLYHALALLALAAAPSPLWQIHWTSLAGWSWIWGVIIFSGSLYLLAFTGARWFGAITPVGGMAFIVGWVMVVLAATSKTSL